MAAKTLLNTVNDWSNPAHFNPAGVPVAGTDTLTITGGQELRFPSGVTLVCMFTATGTDDTAYAKLTVQHGGTLKLYASPTINNWVSTELQGNASIDLNGNDFLPQIADANGVRFKVYATGTALGGAKTIVKSTAAKGNFLSSNNGEPLGCFVDFNNFELDNIHWRGGGSYYAGNTLRMENGLVKNYGAFVTAGYQNDGVDVVLKNIEFRNCNDPQDINIGTVVGNLGFHPTGDENGGDITGERAFENIVFDATDTPGTQIKVNFFWLRGFTPKNIFFLNCQPNDDRGGMYWDGVFAQVRNEGNAAFGVLNADNLAVVSNGDNPKHFTGSGTWNDPVVECKWLSGVSTDAGDIWVIGNVDPLVLNRVLLIDEFGSGIVNALSSDRGADVTVNGATYVADVLHPQNGFFRNEGGGRYTGEVKVHNCLNYIRSNPTNAPVIYGFNFSENTAPDQLTSHGHNCWVNYPSTANTSLYHEVNSLTKTLGQPDWGDNDIFDNPVFVDDSRGIISWGTAHGAPAYADAIQALAKGVNGYNKATGTFNSADIVIDTVKIYLAYIKGGYAPTATIYQFNDTTGTRSRGAVQWVPAGGGGGTVTNLQNYALTNYGLRSAAL